MDAALKLFGFCLIFAGCRAQIFLQCDWILDPSFHCDRLTSLNETILCGTNNLTYANQCHFTKAHCADPTLHIKHEGPCWDPFGTTPATPIDGAPVAFDLFCTQLSHKPCGTEDYPICASDRVTYANFCEFNKQKCTHRKLEQVMFEACSTP